MIMTDHYTPINVDIIIIIIIFITIVYILGMLPKYFSICIGKWVKLASWSDQGPFATITKPS